MIDENSRIKVCPHCGNAYRGYPAVSRQDPFDRICPDCGTREALDSIGVSKEEQDKIIGIINSTDIHN